MARTSVVDINHIASAVNDILQEYGAEIAEDAAVSAQEVGKEVVKQLKKTSPKRPKSGKYAKSWKMDFTQTRWGSSQVIVYNDKHYQLTHLLENGHANRDGGRTDAIPHIKPAEEFAIKAFEEKITELIER